MKKKRLPLRIVRNAWKLQDAGNQASAGIQHAGRAGPGQRIDRAEVRVHEKVIPETDRRQAQLKRGAGRRKRHAGQLGTDVGGQISEEPFQVQFRSGCRMQSNDGGHCGRL